MADPYADLPLDKIRVNNADLLISTTIAIMDYYNRFDKPIIHISHGISKEEFNVDKESINEIK